MIAINNITLTTLPISTNAAINFTKLNNSSLNVTTETVLEILIICGKIGFLFDVDPFHN